VTVSIAVNTPEVVPSYFGGADSRLFGIYHAPHGGVIRDAGIVLCYPGPQEYSQIHWAYHKLASMLAELGFHVFRFDYSGTGDSLEASDEASITNWSEEISMAVTELREIAGVRRVSLVTTRLGSALALRAIAAGLKVRDVVLWDPVTSGQEYVRILDAMEDLRLRNTNFPEPDQRVPGELLGYSFPDRVRMELRGVDLLTEPIGRAKRLLLVAARLNDAQRALARRLVDDGAAVTVQEVDDPALHSPGRHPNDALLSHNIPVAIASFLGTDPE
jgi:uncharacterized protein